jgi:hypothetical protein
MERVTLRAELQKIFKESEIKLRELGEQQFEALKTTFIKNLKTEASNGHSGMHVECGIPKNIVAYMKRNIREWIIYENLNVDSIITLPNNTYSFNIYFN